MWLKVSGVLKRATFAFFLRLRHTSKQAGSSRQAFHGGEQIPHLRLSPRPAQNETTKFVRVPERAFNSLSDGVEKFEI